MRLFVRNTLIALIGVAALALWFWCFGRAFDWVVFHVFHVPAKSQSVLVRELRSLCMGGLGGVAASRVLKLKPKLSPLIHLQTPESYSVAEPLAFGLVVFAMMFVGAVMIMRFH